MVISYNIYLERFNDSKDTKEDDMLDLIAANLSTN